MQVKETAIKSEQLTEQIVAALKETKGKDIVILDLRKIESAVTDYFIICSGETFTQLEGIASTVVRNTRKELHQKPWHLEGSGVTGWILLDYVNVVVHLFQDELRKHYNLEELWADAERTDIENID